MPEFQTSPGMRDILPPDSARWRRLNTVFADVVESAGYGQVITPLIEDVGVFTRIGEATDVVTKERDKMQSQQQALATLQEQALRIRQM